jgi:hypothetical protein
LFTLGKISTFKIPLRTERGVEEDAEKIGATVSESNLNFSLYNSSFFNLKEFDKSYPKPKYEFSSYVIKTPFGYWIPKPVYLTIEKLYKPFFDNYVSSLRKEITPRHLDLIIHNFLSKIKMQENIFKRIDLDIELISKILFDWQNELLRDLTNDKILHNLFFGYEIFEFPIDPNYLTALNHFSEFTGQINYKKEPKKPAKNLKNELRPFITGKSEEFQNLKIIFENINIKIIQKFNESKTRQVELKFNSSYSDGYQARLF